MLKNIFFISLFASFLTSCSSEQSETKPSSDANETASIVDSVDIYEKNWQILKQAIIEKNEAVVLTFVSNEDPFLKDAIHISYEYIFDDEVIEKIKHLNFNQLDHSGGGNDENNSNSYIHLTSQTANDSLNQIFESTLEIEFTKTANGLKITNYKTFDQTYDTKGL